MSYTTNKGLVLPAFNSGSWNTPLNDDFGLIDTAFGGVTSINATGTSGTITLTEAQYRPPFINVAGSPSADVYYSIPSGKGGQWTVNNGTSTFSVYMVSAAGGSAVRIPRGYRTIVSCDGSAIGMRLSISTPASPGGTDTQVQYNSSDSFAGSANLTFNGTTLTANALTVTNAATAGSLTVTGAASAGSLTVTGATSAGSLTVTGATSAAAITASGAVTATGAITTSNNLVLSGQQAGGPPYYSYTLGSAPGGTTSVLQFFNDGTTYAGARFVVGSPSTAEYQFRNDGNATATVAWVSLSDRRIKDNQQRIENSLGRVARLTGLTYTRNDITQMNGAPIVSAGLLAQDVAAVLPEAVSIAGPAPASDPEGLGLMALNYDAVIALLVNAVNELKAKVDALEARG
jgi:hypothetical protein